MGEPDMFIDGKPVGRIVGFDIGQTAPVFATHNVVNGQITATFPSLELHGTFRVNRRAHARWMLAAVRPFMAKRRWRRLRARMLKGRDNG